MSIEITRLQQAIEQFVGRAPRDLPDGVLDKVKELGTSLSEVTPAPRGSPGMEEAKKVAFGTDGTGEHYSRAAKGPDQPSPGQREAMSVSAEIEKAAATIAQKIKEGQGAGEGTSQPSQAA